MSIFTLQRNLNVLGYEAGAVDGILGPKTQAAAVQFALRALVTPVSVQHVPATGSGLSHTPTADGARRVPPPWLTIAQGELDRDVIEQPGGRHHPRIVEYHKVTSLAADDDETPWCASGACWCLQAAGLDHPGSAKARSFLGYGERLLSPRYGCIVVFSRPPNPDAGHVAFWLGQEGARVRVLGGNQANRWSVATFPADRVLGYRWPKGYRHDG